MSTKQHGIDESDDLVGSLNRQIARSCTLGVDEQNRVHHWYGPANSVIVTQGRDLLRREYLGDRLVAEWVAFVREDVGWARHGAWMHLAAKYDRLDKEELGDE